MLLFINITLFLFFCAYISALRHNNHGLVIEAHFQSFKTGFHNMEKIIHLSYEDFVARSRYLRQG